MAKRGNRVARSKDDLQNELREQLELLGDSCDRYDSGKQAIGRHIALSLRVLLHHHGQSRSLLEQLGLRAGKWLDSAGPLNPRNLLTDSNLLIIRATDAGAQYLPKFQMGDAINTGFEDFPVWWTRPVLKDNKGRFMSRFDIVSHIANSDGGAHVDPELDEAYAALSRQSSLGWHFAKGDIVEAIVGRPELACARQIAHEVLETLKLRAPAYLKGEGSFMR